MELYEWICKYGKGKGEAMMWDVTKMVSEYIKPLRETDKEGYWMMIRRVFGALSGGHYDEEFARHDISKMLPRGEYWSLKQVEDATKGMSFPQGATPCDKWVAFNAFANESEYTNSRNLFTDVNDSDTLPFVKSILS